MAKERIWKNKIETISLNYTSKVEKKFKWSVPLSIAAAITVAGIIIYPQTVSYEQMAADHKQPVSEIELTTEQIYNLELPEDTSLKDLLNPGGAGSNSAVKGRSTH